MSWHNSLNHTQTLCVCCLTATHNTSKTKHTTLVSRDRSISHIGNADQLRIASNVSTRLRRGSNHSNVNRLSNLIWSSVASIPSHCDSSKHNSSTTCIYTFYTSYTMLHNLFACKLSSQFQNASVYQCSFNVPLLTP